MVTKHGETTSLAKIVCDRQECIPLTKVLAGDDQLVLLTPSVPPLPGQIESRDPFEVFGKALVALGKDERDEKAWQGGVMHVPYTAQGGIHRFHADMIREARVVIFVTSGLPAHGQPDQADLAEAARQFSGDRPQIVLACCSFQGSVMRSRDFPTILQISQYSDPELLAAAALLFGRAPDVQARTGASPVPASVSAPAAAPAVAVAVPIPSPASAPAPPVVQEPRQQQWRAKEWRTLDMPGTFDLWNLCLPSKYHLPQQTLLSLLDRDGWAKHFVVRDPANPERLLGFCATYMCFMASSQDDLIASLAMLIVRPEHRGRGIGWALHSQAVRHLKTVQGVIRVQLGSTVPRLLYGPPGDMPDLDLAWFARRGWPIGGSGGSTEKVCDWVLRFDDLPSQSFAPAGLTFRFCETDEEIAQVLDIAENESKRQNVMGWWDQYAMLKPTPYVSRNVLVCREGDMIVAAALVYTPDDGSPIPSNLPWAAMTGTRTGGVSCICIADKQPGMVSSRNAIMIRLLDACIRVLADRGMTSLYIDAVRGGDDGFQSIGFQKWSVYHDIWKSVDLKSLPQQWPFDSY